MPSREDVRKDQKSDPDGGKKDLESVGMEELLEIYEEGLAELAEGEIVRGRVMQITPTEAIVDIGYKSEGLVPIDQLKTYDGTLKAKVGDRVDVFIEKLEDPSGYVLLSRDKAERVIVWDELEKKYQAAETIQGRIIDRVKGGLSVDVGVKAFLPGSLVDTRPVKNLESLRGKEFEFKIISFDKKRSNIVISRRAILEVEENKKKKETFERLRENEITHGSVKNITDYGVFVDLGGVDGLLHITDISWGRVNHPSEFFNVGDEIDVVVLKIDQENERVSLGFKQKRADPWLDVAVRYPIASRVSGRVVSLTDYGAFVELEEGVEGLIHISEMSWTRRVRPSKLLSVGETVEAVVSDVNVPNRRISLSLRALEANPWDTVAERYPVGSTIEGKVRNLTDFGAFVEVEEGIDGLVHISDMSWSRRLRHPSEVLHKGDEVKARVISVDPDAQRLSLSIKEFMPNEWDEYAKQHDVGDDVVGRVAKITDFGLFIALADGVEGLAHISEIGRDGSTRIEEMFHPGDPIRARVIKLDWAEKKIGLSLRDVEPLTEAEIAEMASAPSEPEPGSEGDTEAAREPEASDDASPSESEAGEDAAGSEGDAPAEGSAESDGEAPAEDTAESEGDTPAENTAESDGDTPAEDADTSGDKQE